MSRPGEALTFLLDLQCSSSILDWTVNCGVQGGAAAAGWTDGKCPGQDEFIGLCGGNKMLNKLNLHEDIVMDYL